MIQGMVNATYEAVILLTLQGPAGQTQDIEAGCDSEAMGSAIAVGGSIQHVGRRYHEGTNVPPSGDQTISFRI